MGHVYPYWQIMLTKLPDYYFSFMKLIVSTFLVYKVKKCLLKSGKVTPRQSFCPFRACCFWSFWAFSPYLNHLRNFNYL